MRKPNRSCGLVSVMVASVLVLVLGCRPPRPDVAPATEAPPRSAELQLATPQDTARTFLSLLRADVHALAQQDLKAAAAARDQVAWYVTAREDVAARLPRGIGARGRDPILLIARCVETWSADVAYYVDGFDFDRMRNEVSEKDGYVTVRVPARAADDAALLRVSCVRGTDGQWRVRNMQFAERATLPAGQLTVLPASQPASAPTSRP